MEGRGGGRARGARRSCGHITDDEGCDLVDVPLVVHGDAAGCGDGPEIGRIRVVVDTVALSPG